MAQSLKVKAPPSTSDQLVKEFKINKYTHTLALIFILHGQKNPTEENNFGVDNPSPPIQRDLRSKLALLTERGLHIMKDSGDSKLFPLCAHKNMSSEKLSVH